MSTFPYTRSSLQVVLTYYGIKRRGEKGKQVGYQDYPQKKNLEISALPGCLRFSRCYGERTEIGQYKF